MEAGTGGDLSTIVRSGLMCGGLGSKFGWGPGPSIGVEWVVLVCTWGADEACVSRYPAMIH